MKKGIVYKIELDNEMYIGSTEQQLCDRQRGHNSDMKNEQRAVAIIIIKK